MNEVARELNPEPICSVCIANYNGESMLRDCIDSVLAQDNDGHLEIIVHDDASSDGSIALLRNAYPQVRVLQSSINVGFCIANNRMVAQARGKFVLLLNNDATLAPDAIRSLLGAANSIAMPAILTLPQRDWTSGSLVDYGCLLDPLNTPTPNLDAQRHEVAFVIGACLWTSCEAWKALGGFPEWLESIGEDLYLCCAARLRGWHVRCVPTSSYRHRQGASFGGNRIDDDGGIHTRYHRRHLSERNRLMVFSICTPTWIMWPWLATQVTLLILEGVLLSLFLRSTRPWKEIYFASLTEVWRMRRTILNQRHLLQTNHTCTLFEYLRAFTPRPRKLIALLRNGLPNLH